MPAAGEAMGVAMPAAGEASVEALGLAAAFVASLVAASVAAGKEVASGAVVGVLPPGAVHAANVPNKIVMTMNPLSDRRSLFTTPDDVSIMSPIHSSRLPPRQERGLTRQLPTDFWSPAHRGPRSG
jgi:hypothetical protein